MKFLALISSFAALSAASPARIPSRSSPLEARQSAAPAYETHKFTQKIDHFLDSPRYEPHDHGTFEQGFVLDTTYYKPGGPVFLYIGGETDLASRFSNLETGIIQILMQAFNGVGVILENRYYGDSYPYNTSTTDNLRYLTTEQTIADNAWFAQNVQLPGIDEDVCAPKRAWIMYGGSLAGAQTSFTMKTYNSVFAGGIAASGTTQAMLAYPYWYDPIIKYGPSDCTSRILNIISNIDEIIFSGNQEGIKEVEDVFGLPLHNLGDFAMTIAFPLGGPMNYPTNTWQELSWYGAPGSGDFWNFCSNVTQVNPPEDIAQGDYALSKYTHGQPWPGLGGYADYVKKILLPMCTTGRLDSTDIGCFGTQNQTFYEITTNSAARSYLYSTCTESGIYQTAKNDGPTLISRVLQIPYTQQWCTWAFPAGEYNKIPPTPQLEYYNKYGGFNLQADRLAFIDGEQDVWLDLCYHSNLAPAPRISSDLHPSYLIESGGHHWDSYGIKNISAEPQFIREAHLWEIRTTSKFLNMHAGTYNP